MSGYEVEHNVPKDEHRQQPTRRPDLSTFFTTLDLVDTSGTRQPQNEHSQPLPQDISAAFRNLANAFEMMNGDDSLMRGLVESLMESAQHPPSQVEGVSDEFIEQLERVPKKSLKADMACPICGNGFLEDQYPLVVRLPCHKDHIFDLECIQPWLKLNPTCPLDRQVLVKKKEPPKKKTQGQEDDEEDEFDDMYA